MSLASVQDPESVQFINQRRKDLERIWLREIYFLGVVIIMCPGNGWF
jgi:hypothetical protein